MHSGAHKVDPTGMMDSETSRIDDEPDWSGANDYRKELMESGDFSSSNCNIDVVKWGTVSHAISRSDDGACDELNSMGGMGLQEDSLDLSNEEFTPSSIFNETMKSHQGRDEEELENQRGVQHEAGEETEEREIGDDCRGRFAAGAVAFSGPSIIPCSIVISGATGHNAIALNGIYDPRVKLSGTTSPARYSYQKRGDEDMWIVYHPELQVWMISSTSANAADAGDGWAYLSCPSGCRPEQCVSDDVQAVTAAGGEVYDNGQGEGQRWFIRDDDHDYEGFGSFVVQSHLHSQSRAQTQVQSHSQSHSQLHSHTHSKTQSVEPSIIQNQMLSLYGSGDGWGEVDSDTDTLARKEAEAGGRRYTTSASDTRLTHTTPTDGNRSLHRDEHITLTDGNHDTVVGIGWTPAANMRATPALVSVHIRGAKGPHSVSINGTFDPTPTLYGGMHRYQRRGSLSVWLEYVLRERCWQVKPSTALSTDQCWAFFKTPRACCNPELAHAVNDATVWVVFVGTGWVPQARVTMQAESPSVHLRGAVGPHAQSINGIFDPTEELSGGRPVYQRRGGRHQWIEYHASTQRWIVKSTSQRGTDNGWASVATENESFDLQIGRRYRHPREREDSILKGANGEIQTRTERGSDTEIAEDTGDCCVGSGRDGRWSMEEEDCDAEVMVRLARVGFSPCGGPETFTGVWRVFDGSMWLPNTALQAHELSPALRISGASGAVGALINGVYVASDSLCGSMPVYCRVASAPVGWSDNNSASSSLRERGNRGSRSGNDGGILSRGQQSVVTSSSCDGSISSTKFSIIASGGPASSHRGSRSLASCGGGRRRAGTTTTSASAAGATARADRCDGDAGWCELPIVLLEYCIEERCWQLRCGEASQSKSRQSNSTYRRHESRPSSDIYSHSHPTLRPAGLSDSHSMNGSGGGSLRVELERNAAEHAPRLALLPCYPPCPPERCNGHWRILDVRSGEVINEPNINVCIVEI